MDINTASLFNLISGIEVKETMSNFMIRIQPGSFCRMDKDFSTNGVHHHNFYELCFVVSGTGEYIHGNEQFIIQENDVFISTPGIKHEIRLLKDSNGEYAENLYLVFYMIEISPVNDSSTHSMSEYEEKTLTSFIKNRSIRQKSCGHLLAYLDFLKSYMVTTKGSNYGIHNMIRSMAFEGMFCLTELPDKQNLPDTRRESNFQLALMFIESNLNRKLLVGDIALHIFTSERNLHYMFKEYLNKTVNNYLNERKMTSAALYLRMKYKVGDVGSLVGINDPAQFSRLFKKYYGMSPKKYQMGNT